MHHRKPEPTQLNEVLGVALEKIEKFANFQKNEIVLTPEELNCLTGKYRTQPRPRRQFSVGILCPEEPIRIKEETPDYAWRLRQIGDAFGDQVNDSTVFGLKLFWRNTPPADLLAQRKADFLVLDAASWLEVRARFPGATLVACEAENSGGIIFTHERTGLQNLRQLSGARMAFPDARLSICPLAKARLVEVGVYASNLRNCTAFSSYDPTHPVGRLMISQRETMVRVQEGVFDVGVTSKGYFKTANPRGLVQLDAFPDLPKVWVARPGLPQETIQAFRKTLLSLKQRKPPSGMPLSAVMGYAEVNEKDWEKLRQAHDAAARFDGKSHVTNY